MSVLQVNLCTVHEFSRETSGIFENDHSDTVEKKGKLQLIGDTTVWNAMYNIDQSIFLGGG